MTTRMPMTEADKAEVWTRRARGEPVPMIARHMGRDRGTVWKVVTATGGIPPRAPHIHQRPRGPHARPVLLAPVLDVAPTQLDRGMTPAQPLQRRPARVVEGHRAGQELRAPPRDRLLANPRHEQQHTLSRRSRDLR